MPPLKINAKLLPMKMHYFLFNAGIAPMLIFGAVFAKQLGYSVVTVGSIYTVLPLIGMVSKPAFGMIADKFKQRRLMFILPLVLCFLCNLALIFIPPRDMTANAELRCHDETHMVNCDDDITSTYEKKLRDSHLDSNATIQCMFSCKGTQEYMDAFCSTWQVKNFCVPSHDVNSIHDGGFAGKSNKLADVGKLSMSKQKAAKAISIQEEFKFQGDILLSHTTTLSNCKYARVYHVKFLVDNSTIHVPYCKSDISTRCNVTCKDVNFVEAFDPSVKNVVFRYEFWLLFIVFIVDWAGLFINHSISDTVCFELLGNEPHKYGYTRLYGSLGWGLSSIFTGWLADLVSGGSAEKNYVPVFVVALIFLALNIIVAFTVKVEQTRYSVSILRDINRLFKDKQVVIFTVWCFYMGVCSAVIWDYLFWYLENISTAKDHSWSKTLQGLDSLFGTVFGEIPFFFVSGWFITKFGHIHVMSMILVALAARLLLYSILSRPVWVLPIELLNGPTFGLFYATMTSYVSIIAPAGAEATAQGLFGSAFDGFGIAVGGLVGSILFETCSGATTYKIFGFITLFFCLVHVLIRRIFPSDSRYLTSTKDYNSTAHYTTPHEAAIMLDER